MSSEALTEAQKATLGMQFRGPRPSNNVWSFLRLETPAGDIMGEEIDALIRSELLIAEPVSGEIEAILGGPSPYGEIPDIEMTHKYRATPAGRALLHKGESE